MSSCGADAVHPYFFHVLLRLWRWATIANTDHQINEEIRDKEVRLIGADGEQLGIMSSEEALRIATEQEYDLVKIAPGSNPPVCRIMDYGKYRFEQTKKEKEAKKNQRVIEIKEIRMSPGIDTNDFNTKLKNGQKFLADGNRLKISVRFRGREMAHTEIGAQLLKDGFRRLPAHHGLLSQARFFRPPGKCWNRPRCRHRTGNCLRYHKRKECDSPQRRRYTLRFPPA